MRTAITALGWNSRWVPPVALGLLVVITYATSVSGGFLNYDDPWLIVQNPVLRDVRWSTLFRIWASFDDATRSALGAEYLPVRDTTVWLEWKLFGPNAQLMRVVNLAIYVLGVLGVRAYLRQLLGRRLTAEAAAWLFALHPVHAESVAWLAGRKDVLALAFVAWALWLYARGWPRRPWVVTLAVPLLLVGATLSKGVAVIGPLLLLLHDAIARRRPNWEPLVGATAFVTLIVAAQARVGTMVGMVASPLGGDWLTAAASMGPVWLRYLRHAFAPLQLSVVYDVTTRMPTDLAAWLGWVLLIGWGVLGYLAWRLGRGLLALAFGWFALGLLPTSQVLVPLQNVMADRYLLLAVLGPCLLAAAVASSLPLAGMYKAALLAFAVTVLASLTAVRADKFADSVALWADAWQNTRRAPLPAYQLALAQRQRGDDRNAEIAFREAMARSGGKGEVARRATNNLAALLVRTGRLEEAEKLLRVGRARFPDDPKLLANLARVLAMRGATEESRELFDQVTRGATGPAEPAAIEPGAAKPGASPTSPPPQ